MNDSLTAASVPVPHGCRTMIIDGIFTCTKQQCPSIQGLFFHPQAKSQVKNTWHGKIDNPRAMKSQLWVAKLANESVSDQQILRIGFIWFYLDIVLFLLLQRCTFDRDSRTWLFWAIKSLPTFHCWNHTLAAFTQAIALNIWICSSSLRWPTVCLGTRLRWPGAISKKICCWPCRTWLCWFGGPWRWTFLLFVHHYIDLIDSIDSIDLWIIFEFFCSIAACVSRCANGQWHRSEVSMILRVCS